ncbi:gamma-glutamyltranspeptidase [Punctularia strigosozonata HHB-11173 SS5]|uniref:gamma-glutamyltranspeptidase n=1 Tax=Punctularia strigosozonata (strain HHB-11173) TaxID=741275 RepID=UPI00044185C3|nr:gamma-glutamyltranspeptidase [Punctularia strigosozonata HHB-11173 SS5]EIN14105.1 gamma-glutamyltranspeptidase [Punctularia strigosozonata HHB-11173 SS5]
MSPVQIDWSKVDHPEHLLQRFPSRRSIVYGTKGVVSSSQPLATEAGLEILRKGGNAADAAVATSAALNVTEPSCCGIGGDAFCLFFDAKTKEVKALNGSGHSPQKLTLDYVRSRGIDGSNIPATDLNSVTVPGAAAAWVDTVEKFGSGRLSVAEVLAPAIRLAEEGVPVSEIHGFSWKRSEQLIKNASPNADEMLLNGRAPKPGEIMTFPTLAQTFREVAEKGKDGFYKGRVAQAIVHLIQSKGGVMELEDLAKHETTFVEPIKYTYGGDVTVYECPPNGQGITALLALGILESMQEQGIIGNILEMEHNSPEYLHTLVETLRLAFADSQHFVSDPEVEHVPVEALLNKEYLATRAKLFDPKKTNPQVVHGKPVHSSDTVYFSVTDQWGNACSYIQSNYAGFGTGAIPKGCGFTLQNRGSNFTLVEGHVNMLKGGKRPYHTIIPALAKRGDDLWLSYGVMGGFMQPQGHVQVLLNMLRGYGPQAALDAPRFCISAGSPDSEAKQTGMAGDINSEVYFEEGISDETVNKLREMGHDARQLSGYARGMFGRGQVIEKIVDPSGRTVWAAGSDLRADGHAAAQI